MHKRIVWSIITIIICLSGMFIYASIAEAPIEIQSKMLLKTLGYDRTVLNKDGDVVRIGVLYNENNPESLKAFEVAGDYLYEQKKAGTKIGKKRLKSTGLSYLSEAALTSMVSNLNISVLYVTPGNEANLSAIANVAKAKNILTFGGCGDYVSHGLAIGVEMNAGKPQVIVNLTNAKAQGADFKAEFLKLAKVVN